MAARLGSDDRPQNLSQSLETLIADSGSRPLPQVRLGRRRPGEAPQG